MAAPREQESLQTTKGRGLHPSWDLTANCWGS